MLTESRYSILKKKRLIRFIIDGRDGPILQTELLKTWGFCKKSHEYKQEMRLAKKIVNKLLTSKASNLQVQKL